MLHLGRRDVGFAGADWVVELDADVVELLDLELDPVRLVAAAPTSLLVEGKLPNRPLMVASEYKNLTETWIANSGIDATFVRCYGATEVFPPEDADCIVDNTSSGATLRANNLEIVDELMRSSTRFFASHAAMKNPAKRETIDHLLMLLKSVLNARQRVMIEVNVDEQNLEAVISILPGLRQPTISSLHGAGCFAVKAAVPKLDLPNLIPLIKENGGSDLVVTKISQLVP
jgi:ATP phosphoribosyltransferase-like protein